MPARLLSRVGVSCGAIRLQELTERAWSMLNRALFSRDYDFHRRLYDWLLRDGHTPDKENFFFSLPTSNESFILAYLDSIPDTAEKITRQHQYFTAHVMDAMRRESPGPAISRIIILL